MVVHQASLFIARLRATRKYGLMLLTEKEEEEKKTFWSAIYVTQNSFYKYIQNKTQGDTTTLSAHRTEDMVLLERIKVKV